MTALRKKYAAAALVYLAFAFLTKYYHGPGWRFSEAYLGDVFIVSALYFFLAWALPETSQGVRLVSIGAFATVVELFQATGIPASLNLPRPFVFMLGSAFDAKDFLFYFAGLLLAWLTELSIQKG